MKIMRSLVFLLVIYVLLCNNTNAEAASKVKEAKIAYAKYLQSVCPLDENIFCHTKKWKGKWVPLELNRGYVKKWIWE